MKWPWLTKAGKTKMTQKTGDCATRMSGRKWLCRSCKDVPVCAQVTESARRKSDVY